MSRVRMVTRTVTITVGTALVLDMDTNQTRNSDFTLTGHFKDDEAINKVLQKDVHGNVRVIAVLSYHERQERYGMTEENFIANATVLPVKDGVDPEMQAIAE